MKRFFVGLWIGTLLALGCVHQKIGLIRLGYEVEALGQERDELLDQHRVFQYNVLTLRSPAILQERLAQRNIQLSPPRTVEVLRFPFQAVASAPPPGAASRPALDESDRGPALLLWQRALRLAAGWLGAGRQAVAEPLRESS